jgi:hypothetical protein
MRLLLLLVSVMTSFGAVTNEVRITERTGSAQTNRPFSIARSFKQGELSAYAKPVVQGNVPSTWQCDRKTTWSDGSLRFAIVSFFAPLDANETIIVSFINSTNPCSSGDETTCNAAALSQQQMLDFNGGSWTASMPITNGTTQTANARTMLEAGAWRWWLRGPVVSQVIVEDRTASLTYDLGWDAHKSLHPSFFLTFYSGWGGMHTNYIMENNWTTKVQDQTYSLELHNSEGVIYSKASFTHQGLARWRKPSYPDDPAYWDGNAPGAVKIDYNFPYILRAQSLPSYDTTRSLTETHILNEISVFNSRDSGDIMTNAAIFGGSWYKGFAGVNPESPFYSWEVRYLYSGGDTRLRDIVHRNANVSGYVPIHYRESLAGRTYSTLDSSDAFGKVISLDARPTVRELGRSQASVLPEDAVVPVAARTMNNWQPDTAHQYAMTYIAYLLSGDYFYLEEMYFWAAWSLMRGNPPANSGSTNARHMDWGNIAPGEEPRGEAWALRSIALAAAMAPDGSSEKAYYTQKLVFNIAIREGRYGIEDGNYYEACTTSPFDPLLETSKWCWGKYLVGENGKSNPLYMFHPGSIGVNSGMHAAQVGTGSSPWMWNFGHHALGFIEQLGFTTVGPLRRKLITHLLHQLKDPAYNPYLTDSYQNPVKTSDTGTPYFSTWASIKAAYLDPDRSAFTSTSAIGYVARAIAAAIYLPGVDADGLIGQEAYDWLHSHASGVYANQNSAGDYIYAFVPFDDSEPEDPPSIITTTLPPGNRAIAYSQVLVASGNGITWTVSVGSLPPGMSLSSPGVLAGTPIVGGSYTFTVTATNSAGFDDQQLTLLIVQPTGFRGLQINGTVVR